MAWERRQYRGNKVWIFVDEAGMPAVDDRGLASMRYKPDDERTYTIRPGEVSPVPPEAEAPGTPPEPIEMWAEAAVAPSADVTGLGVILLWNGRRRVITHRLAAMPLPRAGVSAVVMGLQAIRKPSLPVRVHTSHIEAIQALKSARGEAASSPLAQELKAAARRFRNLRFAARGAEDASPHATEARHLALEATRLPR